MNPSANHTATPAGIIGMPGWFASEQAAGFDRNRWLVSSEYAGCRILAGQLRDAAEARQRRVAERAAKSRACPLDLHRLLPIPDRLLRLGPEQTETLTWLWEHWGTTQALRGVVQLPVPSPGPPHRPDPALVWLGFWSADWTPWRAILAAPRPLAGAAARGPAALR